MRVLLSTGAVRGHGIEEAMEMSSRLGFDGIELIMREPLPRTESVRSLSKKTGQPVISVHMPFFSSYLPFCLFSPGKSKSILSMSMEWASRLGAERLVVHPFPSLVMKGAFRRAMVSSAVPKGLKLSIENMEPRFLGLRPHCITSPEQQRNFASRNGFGITLDTAHAIKSGLSLPSLIGIFGPLLDNIHLAGCSSGKCHLSLDANIGMFRPFLRSLKGWYKGDIVLETDSSSEESMKRDLAFIRKFYCPG